MHVAVAANPATKKVSDWTGRPGAEGRSWPSEEMVRLICRNIPAYQRPALTAVDVGCGSGRNTIGLRQLGFGNVIAIDPLEHMLQATRHGAHRAGVVIDARQGAMPELPLGDETIDLAVAWGMMFILGGPERTAAAIKDLARTMRPDAVLVSDWRTPEDGLLDFAARRVAEDTYEFASDAPAKLGGLVYSFWNDAQVRKFHADAGLSVVAMQRYEIADMLAGTRHAWWHVCARRD